MECVIDETSITIIGQQFSLYKITYNTMQF